MSQYFMTLSGDVRDRYIQKISVIDNFDPYTFTKEHYNIDLEDLPKVDYIDIVNYFVLSHSYYTGKQLKSIKSLEAYKYYKSGFVLEINCTRVGENYVTVGKIKHSQRMNDTPLHPWVVILPEGDISSAHCNCMAGLGEVCSHTAALIFAIHLEQNKDSASCTDKLCSWNVPKTNQPLVPQRVRDIKWGKNISSFKDVEQLKVSLLSRENFHNFLSEVEIANPSAAILSVVQPFASQRTISNVEHLPSTLDKLYETIYESYSLQELRSVNINLSISKNEQEAVQKITLKQSKSHNWFKYKAGRITSSNFKLACKTSVDKPSLSLIKIICYPLKVSIKTKQVMYGINHEDIARKDYESLMKLHQNLQITLSGLVISIDTPMFAASPDGFVSCKCCGPGCIEIKCPYRLLDSRVSIKNIAELRDSFLLIDKNNSIKLKRDHAYFYQVQLQMYCTQRRYCDFVIWSKKEICIDRIMFDLEFLTVNLQKACDFYSLILKPELLARWYTQSRYLFQLEVWCYCLQPDDGRDMIRGSNENCKIKWFHKQCVSVFEIQETQFWFCTECSSQFNEIIIESMKGIE